MPAARSVSRLAWALPIAGFLTAYLLVAGLSLSNVDIRSQAEIVGLAVLALFPAIGLVLSRRAGASPAVVAVNLLLALLVALLAWMAYASKRPLASASLVPGPAIARPGSGSVWIDTDPACGSGRTADVDDCWALALALRSSELELLGVSTVFGNRPKGGTFSRARRADLARAILALGGRNPPLFEGSETPSNGNWRATPASEALASALADSRLEIIALGPLTNVATLLAHHPARARNIETIIMVGGKPPGRLFHPGRHWWFHFGDFNVSRDVAAMRAVLDSGVPITLVPFELAVQVVITQRDIERLRAGDALSRWLAEASGDWLAFWQGSLIDQHGFSPFDALAVGYAALPGLFGCRDLRARIGFSVFLAPFGLGRDLEVAEDIDGAPVRYCDTVDARFKRILLQRLSS